MRERVVGACWLALSAALVTVALVLYPFALAAAWGLTRWRNRGNHVGDLYGTRYLP